MLRIPSQKLAHPSSCPVSRAVRCCHCSTVLSHLIFWACKPSPVALAQYRRQDILPMLTGEESTIVTSCSAGDREPMDRAPDPANRVCTGRSVCEVLCRFLAAFQGEQLTDCSSGPAGFTVCCMWSLACPRVRQMTSSPGKCVRAAAHETLFLLHLPSFLPAMGLLRSRSQVGSAVNPRPNDATPHSSPQGPGLLHARLSSKNKNAHTRRAV